MKIGALPIISIGVAVGLMAAAYGFFHHYQPNMATYENTKVAADSWEEEARKLPAAYKKRKAAEAFVQERADAWQKVVSTKTPSAALGSGGIDLGVNPYQLVVDSRVYRNSVQRAVNAQVKRGGVIVDYGGDEIPQPGDSASAIMANYYNYPAIPFPVVIFNLGTIQVRGTWQQIKANVESWANMPNYLAVADGLQVNGTGPILSASYNVVVVGYLKGKELHPAVPETAVAGGAGGAGAGGGGNRPGGRGRGGGLSLGDP